MPIGLRCRGHLEALFQNAARITDVEREQKVIRFAVRNDSDLRLELKVAGKLGPRELTAAANGSVRVKVNVGAERGPVSLSYTAGNFLIGPQEGLPAHFVIMGDPAVGTVEK